MMVTVVATTSELPMRAILLGLLAVSAVAIATPAFAQVTVDTPVGGVRVGPDRRLK